MKAAHEAHLHLVASCDRVFWRVLLEELLVGHSGAVKLVMVSLRAVEELAGSLMQSRVVFRDLDIEVRQPRKLAIDVTFFCNNRAVRHPCALAFVFFIRVELTQRSDRDRFFARAPLTEERLVLISCVGYLPCRNRDFCR